MSDADWKQNLLEVAREAYAAAANVSGSALLAGETPKAKQAEQRRLVYENACAALQGLFCVVDELEKRIATDGVKEVPDA